MVVKKQREKLGVGEPKVKSRKGTGPLSAMDARTEWKAAATSTAQPEKSKRTAVTAEQMALAANAGLAATAAPIKQGQQPQLP